MISKSRFKNTHVHIAVTVGQTPIQNIYLSVSVVRTCPQCAGRLFKFAVDGVCFWFFYFFSLFILAHHLRPFNAKKLFTGGNFEMTRRLKTMIFALQLEATLISASCFAVQKHSVFTRTGNLRSLLGKNAN